MGLEDSLPRRRAWAIALAATFTMTVSQLDRTTLAVIAPTVTKALGISEVGYGWLAAAFSIAYLVASPFSGWWLDRIGPRRGLVLSVLVWSGIAALHSLTLGFASLFALRIALGVAESPSYPGSAATIQRVLPPRERPRGFGVLFTGSFIGVLVAAPLASWLFSIAGWRVTFLGTALVGLAWLPVWLLFTRRHDVRAALDASHTATVAKWHRTIREPKVVRAMIAVLAAAPLQALPLLWGAKYLTRAFQVPQKDIGQYLWIPLAAFDVATVIFGDLASRQRRAPSVPPRLLFVLATGLAACTAFLGHATTPVRGMLILAIGLGGSGGMYTLIVSDLLAHTEPDRVARTSSFLPAAQSLAVIVSSPLIGWSVHASSSYAPSAVALGIWSIPGALVWLLWRVTPTVSADRESAARPGQAL